MKKHPCAFRRVSCNWFSISLNPCTSTTVTGWPILSLTYMTFLKSLLRIHGTCIEAPIVCKVCHELSLTLLILCIHTSDNSWEVITSPTESVNTFILALVTHFLLCHSDNNNNQVTSVFFFISFFYCGSWREISLAISCGILYI